MKLGTGSLLAMIGLLVASLARADLVEDSAAFDQAYIPALAYTSQGDRAKSARAMARLEVAWRSFRDARRDSYPADAQWARGFDDAGDFIAAASGIVGRPGGNLLDAHEALEHVRVIFMTLRRDHQIDYFVDHLTAFHEPMEHIVLAAKGKTQTDLSASDLANIRTSMPALTAAWKAVQGAPLDSSRLKLDARKAADVATLMEKETQAIDALQAALQSGNPTAILKQATAIKPPFAQLFMLFGDFAPGD